jgi:hypothetical protein
MSRKDTFAGGNRRGRPDQYSKPLRRISFFRSLAQLPREARATPLQVETAKEEERRGVL